MPTRLERLLSRGYFPPELPPPFTTSKFGAVANQLAASWSSKDIPSFLTNAEKLSHPRYGHARRNLSIVNPINQLRVAQLISDNWTSILGHLKQSKISEFRPSIMAVSERAVAGVDFDKVNRKKVRLLARYGRYVKTDIARFYPSIYTHSIAWALSGKDWVKKNHNQPTFKASYANQLDRAIRACQAGQSVGLPIGPDTSRVISELIATDIEGLIEKSFSDLQFRAVRYVDDMMIGIGGDETPQTILAKLSSALYEYDLELNAEKTSMHGVGFPHAPEWINFLRSYKLPERAAVQRDSLDSYFEQALYLADANPRENVLLFAVKRAASFNLDPSAWNHFVNWLLYCIRRSSTCLSFVVEFLATEAPNRPLPMARIEEFIRELLPLHSEAAHTSEVCWLLFLARELKITLAADVLRGVTGLRSSACALVTMDLAQQNRIAGKLDTKFWRDFATTAGLRTEMWLAAYEITKKGWWGKPRSNAFIASHEYFSELLAKDVEFYETKRRARKVRPSVFKITRQTEGPVFSDPYR